MFFSDRRMTCFFTGLSGDFRGDELGDRMFVNQVLFGSDMHHDREIVESADKSLEGRAIEEHDLDGNGFLAHLIEETVLEVDGCRGHLSRFLPAMFRLCQSFAPDGVVTRFARAGKVVY